MEITFRDAATMLHGMGFGALLLLGFSGLFAFLYALSVSTPPWTPSARDIRRMTGYIAALAALGWLAVLAGAYVIYPWYRAVPPAGAALANYPQRLLMSDPMTSGWHDLGMEWKEHIAWFAPISLTAVAYVVGRYGARLRSMRGLRNAVIGLSLLAFGSAAVAGFFGAMLNKHAPVRGGRDIVLMQGKAA